MPSFGEKLKREREKRAITLEQISSSTKIGTRMLQALEEERFNQLPGGIFNKGFIRAYARCVGLDEEQAVADYLEASGEVSPVKFAPGAPETLAQERLVREEEKDKPDRELPWGLFAAALLLLALALSVWSYHRRAPSDQITRVNAVPALQNSAPAPPSSQQSPSPAPAGAIAAKLARPAASTANQSAPPAPKAGIFEPKSTKATTQPGEFVVLIQAREDSWISITSDGKPVLTDTLLAGTERAIRGQKEVVVRAGNTGGVDFVFNGKKLPVQGEDGEAKTLTFGVEGLQPKAPAAPQLQ